MAASLLRYANREKVAQALTELGYPVTRNTVNRWARGAEMPEIAARMIGELFSHADTTKGAAPPEWAKRLVRQVDSIAEAVGASDAEDAAERAVQRVVGDGTSPPPVNGDATDDPSPSAPAQRRRRNVRPGR